MRPDGLTLHYKTEKTSVLSYTASCDPETGSTCQPSVVSWQIGNKTVKDGIAYIPYTFKAWVRSRYECTFTALVYQRASRVESVLTIQVKGKKRSR